MKLKIKEKFKLIECAIIKLINWEKEIWDANNESDYDFYNNNTYTKNKILLLPYFLYTANGTRKEMNNVFDDFFAQDIGFVSKQIKNAINDDDELFIHFKIENNLLKFKNDYSLNNLNLEKLVVEKNDFNIGVYENFNDLIDHSIKQYKINNWKLYSFRDSYLTSIFKETSSAWLIFYGYKEQVPQDVLESEMSVFAEKYEMRLVTY